ncbi:MAG TPA: amidohydrolase family protein [Alphaproteobacteria bacterium]|nr:amidohydrolase family protein [Alphaproteobacteria bacterium]
MLIRDAEIYGIGLADLRVQDGQVTAIGQLEPMASDDTVFDAGKCALLPALRDHHFHLLAFAASRESVQCGPPAVTAERALAEALQGRARARPGSWIRGIGYHPSVAGEIDRHWLDTILPTTPARIQHRSGRLWILNSYALNLVATGDTQSPLEYVDGHPTGRLYDGDEWLRERLGKHLPPIREASRFLLSRGVIEVTDTTPTNGVAEFELLRTAQARGDLLQDLLVMGSAALNDIGDAPHIRVGPTKIYLREAALPALADIAAAIAASHAANRPVAFHCASLAELIFALGALEEAGAMKGDRLEHAAVAPPEVLPIIAKLGVTIVTQPNFIAERGDAYLKEVDESDRPWLYRLRGFRDAGIPLAAGTDAPFGNADPWTAMQAAVTRSTASGAIVGGHESLSPEAALALFSGPPDSPGALSEIRIGSAADLCLIDRPWSRARTDLLDVQVTKVIKGGRIVWPDQSDSASISPH